MKLNRRYTELTSLIQKKKKKPSQTRNAQVPIFKGIEDNAALFKCYDFKSSSLRYSFPTGLKHADV